MTDIFPTEEVIEKIRKEFPKGTKVELVSMDDFQAPPVGTHGIVRCVDDTGTVMVRWENGSGLGFIYGVDEVKKL